MKASETAIILIGFQYDYFDSKGILRGVIEESSKTTGVLEHTIETLEKLKDTDVVMISTPICFSPDYSEMDNPTGILALIKDVGAFLENAVGSGVVPEIAQFGDRVVEYSGKRGLNAFSNTELHEHLVERGIKNIVLAGVVTSLCIDSTARAAYERGYQVVVLSDCTSGRSNLEQQFYCENIFPLYANVLTHDELLASLAEGDA